MLASGPAPYTAIGSALPPDPRARAARRCRFRTGRSALSHPLNRFGTIKRIFGDLISYQNDR